MHNNISFVTYLYSIDTHHGNILKLLVAMSRVTNFTQRVSDSFCCLTSTEARRPIRDGDERERGTEE